MSGYSYTLDVFEGPLDLLLHLIEKHKIDIYDIPIVAITSQYMEYLDNWNHFDIHYSSEFLVMASTLLQIKSRMLLPKLELVAEDEEDPRDELVTRLVEFKAIKEFTQVIMERTHVEASIYTRPEELSQWGQESYYQFDVSKLYDIFKDTFKRAQEEEAEPPKVQVEKDAYSLEDMLDSLLLCVRSGERMSFRNLLTSGHNKKEMVTTFMAILELLKRQEMIILPAASEEDIILVHPDHVSPDEWPSYMEEADVEEASHEMADVDFSGTPERTELNENQGYPAEIQDESLEKNLEGLEEEAAYDN